MFRATSLALAALAAVAAWPAMAQERGGLSLHGPAAMLDTIEANRGCPLSATSATIGVNRAFGAGSVSQQRLGTVNPQSGSNGCQPLVSTQVAAGFNLALGRGSQAGQTIDAQGPRGALATNTFSHGFNAAVGARSTATQRILNQVGR
jgi:hypothetical protein